METKNKDNVNKVIKILPFVLGGITLVFAGLFTWKAVTNNNGGGGGGTTGEKHKLTFAGEDCQLLDQDGKAVTEVDLIDGETYHFTLSALDTNLHDLPSYVVFDDENVNYNYNNQTGDLAVLINKDVLLEASAPYCVTQFVDVSVTDDNKVGALYQFIFGDTKNDPVTIDWGDGSDIAQIDPSDGVDYYNDGISHEYTENGTYTATIRGAVTFVSPDYRMPMPSQEIFGYHCKELILGDRIRGIEEGDYSYYNYEKVIISEGVSYLTDNMFKSCSNLMYLKLPSSLNYLGYNAFNSCDSLETVVFAPYTNFDRLSDGKTLFFNSFSGTALKTVYIGRHSIWHSIVSGEFGGFTELESLIFADENNIPTAIGDGVFGGCSAINVDFLKHVTNIGEGTFGGTYLTSVTFSQKLNYLGNNFASGSNIEKLVFTSNVPPTIHESTFSGFSSQDYDIFVPKGSLETYKKAWRPIVAETTPQVILNLKEAE